MKKEMAVFKCRIILDRKDGIYLKGELVKGIVELESEQDLRQWSKHAELHGTWMIEWQESPRKWQLKRKKILYSQKYLFENHLCWFERPHSANLHEAAARSESENHRQLYNFKFKLKEPLPTSCITRMGQIRYEIKVLIRPYNIRYPLEKHTFEHTQPITVIRTLNPNGMPRYEQPWLFELKPLLKCRLSHDCFVPGQSIHFVLTLANQRFLWFIQSIIVKLQEIQFHDAWNKKGTKSKKLQTSYTLDSQHFGDINYSHELFKKLPENVQHFEGILKIPRTTVPSSNYPIYRGYGVSMKLYHSINITIKPRVKWLHLFHSAGYDKLITIGTQPMQRKGITTPLKQQDDILMGSNNFQCVDSEKGAMMQTAFIPKFAVVETISSVEP